jgi:long-chain acyl-CoA synthetase
MHSMHIAPSNEIIGFAARRILSLALHKHESSPGRGLRRRGSIAVNRPGAPRAQRRHGLKQYAEMKVSDMPWLANYPSNARWDAEIETMPIQQILEQAAARYPDNDAIEFHGRRFSYRELLQLVNRAAKGLQMLGVEPGVRVGLYLPNTPHYVIGFFAILKAGGIVVNYSPLDAEQVIAHKIDDSGTEIMLTLDLKSLYPTAERLLGKTGLKRIVVGTMQELGDASRQPDADTEECSEVAWGERCLSFAQLCNNDSLYRAVSPSDIDNDVAVLQYTGGTTGLSKGAMLTHANLTAGCSQALLSLSGENGLEEGAERLLVVLPLFHIYALTFNMLLGIRVAGLMILHPRFKLEQAVRELAEKKVTLFFGVPTMFTAINGLPGVEAFDLSSLKFSNSGGAPLPLEVHQRFEKLTGCRLQEGWGMTEVCGVGTNTPRNGATKAGSCGVPLPGVRIRFASVDDPSNLVPYGMRGEICIAGPNVMKGYWKRPDATTEVMTADGYLRTGDVGYMDKDGSLWIVDRIKDMILCGGFNVYPRNLEEAIYRHPAVAEVMVIGVPDPYRGQHPKAFITLKQGAKPFSLEELKHFLAPYLGKHEMVQALEFRDALPKTAVGKLSKKDLYDEARRTAA